MLHGNRHSATRRDPTPLFWVCSSVRPHHHKEPTDTAGNPNASGKYVFLSIGIGNAAQEFCSASGAPPCNTWTFTGQAAADPGLNHSTLAIVNGAADGQTADTWESPTASNYDRIRDTRLSSLELSEKQVQVAWFKVANAQPAAALPDPAADAYNLEAEWGTSSGR